MLFSTWQFLNSFSPQTRGPPLSSAQDVLFNTSLTTLLVLEAFRYIRKQG
jgi:hypothetical protein